MTVEFYNEAPDVDYKRMREDFEIIWKKNISLVTLRRINNKNSGDYFNDDIIENTTDRDIYLNIQGRGTGSYRRERHGIDTTGQRWHCYALYSEDIQPTDIIYWNDIKFKIENLDTGFKQQYVFQEFDIVKISKDDQ